MDRDKLNEVTLRVNKGDEDIEQLAEFLKGKFDVLYDMNSDTIVVREKAIKPTEPSYQKYRTYQRELYKECWVDAVDTLYIDDITKTEPALKAAAHSLALEMFDKRCTHLHYYITGNGGDNK